MIFFMKRKDEKILNVLFLLVALGFKFMLCLKNLF